MKYSITLTQAKQFMLLKQGLINDYRYGKDGILEFINKTCVIQYDPVDLCSRNADIILHSRIEDYDKEMFTELLYHDRLLIEHWDKNLSIFNINDWPYFTRIRDNFKNYSKSKAEVSKVLSDVTKLLEQNDYLSSKDIDMNEKVDWYWTKTAISKAALETMYYYGDVMIHHRKGNIRYFSLSEKLVSKDLLTRPDPFNNDDDYLAYRVNRRIKAVSLLWNKTSDAFLFIQGLSSNKRNLIFQKLVQNNTIIEIEIQGFDSHFYISKEDESTLLKVLSGISLKPRTEFLAPLDSFLWDRKLIKELFNFDYKWEIYNSSTTVKYGRYTLPILHGIDFIGRIEIIMDRKLKEMHVKNIWFENNIQVNKEIEQDIMKCLERFMKLNQANKLVMEVQILQTGEKNE